MPGTRVSRAIMVLPEHAVVLRLHVDDNPAPIKELRRLVEIAAAQRGRRR
jgi:uncharacterized Ntn-hydrolase superfamily protein